MPIPDHVRPDSETPSQSRWSFADPMVEDYMSFRNVTPAMKKSKYAKALAQHPWADARKNLETAYLERQEWSSHSRSKARLISRDFREALDKLNVGGTTRFPPNDILRFVLTGTVSQRFSFAGTIRQHAHFDGQSHCGLLAGDAGDLGTATERQSDQKSMYACRYSVIRENAKPCSSPRVYHCCCRDRQRFRPWNNQLVHVGQPWHQLSWFTG